ncbi:hypothetical protein StoSoilB19_10160 [Arthrobacter sp. StoSoilB19]|nr:hypothetical protein StoSoilB19_10160 [Arthrobacter sp. StoSoilB19]
MHVYKGIIFMAVWTLLNGSKYSTKGEDASTVIEWFFARLVLFEVAKICIGCSLKLIQIKAQVSFSLAEVVNPTEIIALLPEGRLL